MKKNQSQEIKNQYPDSKLLLLLLPFWTPMIPPMGICTLKAFLQQHHIPTTAMDANVDPAYKEIYNKYFNKLKEYVPEYKRGNFFSVGTDVLRGHMLGYINRTNEHEYIKLVKLLAERIYSTSLADAQVIELDNIVKELYTWEENYLTYLIEKERPTILGLSVNKDTLPASLFAFRFTRDKYPHIETIMGGTIFSEQLTINSPDLAYFQEHTKEYIDKIIIGPGEQLLLKYLRRQLPGKQRVFTLDDFKEDPTHDTVTVIPDYSDIDTGNYPFMGINGSNGCPYNCSFCNVVKFFGKFTRKDLKQLVNEMGQLFQRYGNQLFFMGDNLVNPYMNELSTKIANTELPIYWSAYMRVDKDGCEKEMAVLWRRGGLYSARLGVDGGSQHVLDLMDKRITPELSKLVIANLASVGIKTTTYWLIGHPGETEEDFQQTLDFLTEMKDDIWEAECEYFNYYYSGQSHSDQWANKRQLVYPREMKKMLMIDKWCIAGEPSWEEIFSRVRRFVQHCKKLGIPNPYSFKEHNSADERWKKLHKNAVPGLLDFKSSKSALSECKSFELLDNAAQTQVEDINFNF